MEVKFTVTKEERKALVRAVGEITGLESVYQGAPSFSFTVGDYAIDRYGMLICGEGIGAEDVRLLLMGLAERGFVFEGDIDEIAPAAGPGEAETDGLAKREGIPGESGVGDAGEGEAAGGEERSEALNGIEADSGRLSIHMPLSGFTTSAIDNLGKLVAAKAWILKKMAGADALPVERDEKHLRFPWFKPDAPAAEIDAYTRLIARLCETAKQKKRVIAKERQIEDGDNEKFKARCFLLSLGFVGEQSKQARKILLAPFSGSGSYKAGSGKKAASEGAAPVLSGESGGYSDCLACANSLSEPAEIDGDADRLFCVVKQSYVGDDGSCDEFNRQGGAAAIEVAV
jgi:hypothetical protein